jgi:osmoprotectant transport system ATP-binding protein
MTVRDNVAVVPRLLGWTPPRIAARVTELLSMVAVPEEPYGSRAPAQLSGGQRQRVGIARALAADPPILLMDEPFGALDPLTRRELRAALQRIQQRLHKTIVLVTHDMAEAAELADRIGVLDAGRLLAIGPASALVRSENPAVRDLLRAGRAAE